jgi:CRP-like cAMP-binding protein
MKNKAVVGASILKSIGWLSRTTPDFQAQLLSIAVWKTAKPGMQISRAGDQGGLIGIAQGTVEISAESGHPDTRFLDVATTGFWAGHRPLIGKLRNATVTARTDLIWVLAPQQSVEQLLRDQPEYWRFIVDLCDSAYETAFELVLDQTRQNGLSRVSATLLRLCGCRQGGPSNQKNGSLHMSQTELAAISMMSRNTFGSYLSRLEQLGLIDVSYRSIRIVDADKLRALLSSDE